MSDLALGVAITLGAFVALAFVIAVGVVIWLMRNPFLR